MARFGLPNLNTEYFKAYREHLGQNVFTDANRGKVIPFVTTHRLKKGYAWSVAVETLYNEGFIPRIYMSYPLKEPVQNVISRLRAISQQTNEVFSVISQRQGRVLISSSYSNGTPEPPKSAA